MPTVSVVIPSARGGVLLREAVGSVMVQTLEDWELVVVMDGCDDEFSDVELDSRVRVIRQSRRGASIARNTGVASSRSPLIAFLDDDDRMLPGRLAAQIEAMRDDKVGLCHTQFRYIDDQGQVIAPGISKESQYVDFLRDEGEILLSSAMVKRSVLDDVGLFNPLLPLCEDLDLIYRVARESHLCFLPEVLTEYRRHDDNASPTTAGGAERKLILGEHLVVAKSHREAEHIRAIRQGMSYTMTGRTELAVRHAHESRVRGNYLGVMMGLSAALLMSPIQTVKIAIRQTKRDRFSRPATGATVYESPVTQPKNESAGT